MEEKIQDHHPLQSSMVFLDKNTTLIIIIILTTTTTDWGEIERGEKLHISPRTHHQLPLLLFSL